MTVRRALHHHGTWQSRHGAARKKDIGCVTTTSLPFDCKAGYDNWEAGWSSAKKQWCCHHEYRGCHTTTELPFDCSAGFSNWQHGWSDAKKHWCCEHEEKGCHMGMRREKCKLWGDPHVIQFDQVGSDKNQAPSFYGDGDFWLVKSSTVSIQARFEGTKYTEGLAARLARMLRSP